MEFERLKKQLEEIKRKMKENRSLRNELELVKKKGSVPSSSIVQEKSGDTQTPTEKHRGRE